MLVDNFIMYDGRVGAAPGLLGRLYAEEHNLATVPSPIEFLFGRGKTYGNNPDTPNRRNPSSERYQLPEFAGRPKRHLKDNNKASWLLKDLADNTKSRFALLPQSLLLKERLIALQSALFMVVYDVLSQAVNNAVVHSSGLEQSEDCQDYPYKTVAKKFRFRVDYDETGHALRFSYPTKENGKRRAPDYFTLNEIERICFYLAKNFNDAPFPLANNVVRLTDFTEQPGLGMAIRTLQGADVLKAQASSHLGPYLAELGILKSAKSSKTMLRLVVEVEKVIPLIREFHINERQ